MRKQYSIDTFSAGHFFEELAAKDSFYCKKFFGGLSIYVFGRMVAFLSEHPEDKEWRGKKFSMDIWNGCLIPSFREHHDSLLKKIKGTMVHPVIEKWLYLPQDSKHFESSMIDLVEMIRHKNPMVGIEPEIKDPRKSKKKKKSSSKPRKISQMMNLGPAVEKDFAAVGIHSADEIIKLGAQKSFLKMLDGRLKIGRSAECCNALYLYALHGAIKDIHWTQIPESKKKEFKEYTAKLRESGKYKNR